MVTMSIPDYNNKLAIPDDTPIHVKCEIEKYHYGNSAIIEDHDDVYIHVPGKEGTICHFVECCYKNTQ